MTNGWLRVPLSQVLRQDTTYVTELESRTYPKLSVKLYGRGVVLDAPADGATVKMTQHQFAKPGQVILSEIWAKKGAIGIVPPEGADAFVTSHFFLFDIDESQLLPGYLGWLLRGNYFAGALDAQARGTTGYAAVRPRQFLTIEIPLPPLPEQQRLVARIEEARGLRRAAVEEAEAFWGAASAKMLRQFEGFERKTIGEICEVRGGLQKSPARIPRNDPTPYLTVAHVQRNRINTSSDFRYFEVSPEELERWRLEPGDLLIIEGNGSADQIGRVALFRGEIKNCVHQNHVIRARPNTTIADPEFLNAYMNSPLGQDEVQKRSRTTSGLRTLSVGRIREIEIPIPSLSEQRRLVAYLDGLQAKVDDLRRLQAATQKELDALLPSVLAKAFAGEL